MLITKMQSIILEMPNYNSNVEIRLAKITYSQATARYIH